VAVKRGEIDLFFSDNEGVWEEGVTSLFVLVVDD